MRWMVNVAKLNGYRGVKHIGLKCDILLTITLQMETEEPAENEPVVEEPGPEEENVTLEPGLSVCLSVCLSASDTVFITIFLGTLE